jgi:hypothetical protein
MATKTNKLPIKDILAAIDMKATTVWDDLSDDERKQVSFYLLNRYASAIKGPRAKQELTILKTNEYYNKHFFTLSKHKKLLWQLLCATQDDDKQIKWHEWIGYKFKDSAGKNKTAKFLKEIYQNLKEDEIELLCNINDPKDIKKYAEDLGLTKEQIKKTLK